MLFNTVKYAARAAQASLAATSSIDQEPADGRADLFEEKGFVILTTWTAFSRDARSSASAKPGDDDDRKMRVEREAPRASARPSTPGISTSVTSMS